MVVEARRLLFIIYPELFAGLLRTSLKWNLFFYLLDDFLTIDRPDSCAERTMALMTTLFKRLNIPLAKHKVVGPCTVIEYLGIILDAEKMEARLPQEKVIRICNFIKQFLNRNVCSKRELL